MILLVTYGLVIVVSLFLMFKIGSWAFPKTRITVVDGKKVRERIKVKSFVPIIAWVTIFGSFLAIAYSSYQLGNILLTKPTPVKQAVTKTAGTPKKAKEFTTSQYDSASSTDLYNTYNATGKKALDSFYEDPDEKNFGVSLIGKTPFANKSHSITLTDLKGKKHVIGKGGASTLIFVLSTDSENSQSELSVANSLVNSNNSMTVLVAFPISARSDIENLYTKDGFTMTNVIAYDSNTKYSQTDFQNIFLNTLSVSKVPSYLAITNSGRVSLAGYGYRSQDDMTQFVSTAFSTTPLYEYMTNDLVKNSATLSSSSSESSSSSSSSQVSSSKAKTKQSNSAKGQTSSSSKSSNPSLLSSSKK